MIPCAHLEFVRADKPILEPVTKFGGQPVWIDTPHWPTSRSTNAPMQFIGQIALEAQLNEGVPFSVHLGSGVAYLHVNNDATEAALLWQC